MVNPSAGSDKRQECSGSMCRFSTGGRDTADILYLQVQTGGKDTADPSPDSDRRQGYSGSISRFRQEAGIQRILLQVLTDGRNTADTSAG